MGLDSRDCPAILDRATRPSVCFKTAHYQHTDIFNTKKNFKNYTCLMTIKLSTLQVPKRRKKQTTGTGRGQRGGKRAVLREAAPVFSLKEAQSSSSGNSSPAYFLQAGGEAGHSCLLSTHLTPAAGLPWSDEDRLQGLKARKP